jgi:methyltransferase (TIGR00027 family)
MTTARGVALLRAVEMTRPEEQRLCADPYARSFVDPLTFHAMRIAIGLGILDVTLPRGTIDFALAREKYVHDLMAREVRAGAQQVVILGAGFDTRIYRIAEAASLPIFEVDHPLTQAAKRQALAGVIERLPAGHRFVAVDFDKDQMPEVLGTNGYDPRLRTLFVWQGVIMYLTAAGVDATLEFVAGQSAPGSLLIFDYFESEILTSPDAAKIRKTLERMGEPITFSLPRGGVKPFLEARGFGDIANVDAAELRRLVMTGANARRHVMPGAAIAAARVMPRG